MIEALKQALEALEKSLPRLAPYGEQDWLDSKAAITSLRQAIREHAMYEVQRLGQEIEQEQGEPVGYLEIDDIESQREYPHNCRNVNLWYESGEGLVAVYTHPPQRTEQEPVAWRLESGQAVWFERTDPEANSALPNDVTAIPLYTTPPAAQPAQEPVAFAGVEMWIGNTRIKKLMTQAELHFAIDPWAIVKFNSDSCIDALKEIQA